MKKFKGKLLIAMLLPGLMPFTAQAGEFYGSLKLQRSFQDLSSAQLTSPRVDYRVDAPDRNEDTAGAIAVGYAFANHWRVEGEYTSKSESEFKSYWSPFDANVNNMQTSSQRLMLNLYRDFAVTEIFSVYAMAGVGAAFIDAEGYQTNPSRRFDNRSQTNAAYSVGMGSTIKLSEQLSLGAGYRFVDMGRIETGYNSFANRINARDEQLKGKLKEQDVFVELRASF